MRRQTWMDVALVLGAAWGTLLGAPATAQEGQPPPAVPVAAPSDPEAYARQLVAAAKTFATAERWGKAYGSSGYAKREKATIDRLGILFRSGRAAKLKSFAILAIGGGRRIELRNPRIKLH